MKKHSVSIETIKEVLENIHAPERLGLHPLKDALFVQEFVSQHPIAQNKSPGEQIVLALTETFRQMLPALPPKQGKRLDSHWGEFGLLAALYFAPLEFGAPQPLSLRDAWGRIDQAIQLFVFGETEEPVPDERLTRYRLVSLEPEIGPASTLSDWHRRGIERLAGIINQEEGRLSSTKSEKATQTDRKKNDSRRKGRGRIWSWLGWALLLIAFLLLSLGGVRAWQIYQRVQAVRQHVEALQSFSISSLNADEVESVSQHLSALHTDMAALQEETAPFLWLAPYLGWLPTYGGDITQAPHLLEMGVQLSITGDEAFQTIAPVLPGILEDQNSISLPELLNTLKDADAQLLMAQVALSRARAARQEVKTERLSAGWRSLLINKIDPLLLSAQSAFPVDDVLEMARISPRLLGAVGNGPQTYLILIQNEDELRPTGGFITAVGKLTVEDGKLTHLSFEGVDLLDDFSKPYPAAPWQLADYMRSEILILRDANWFTNFPTSVEWAKFLYAYTQPGEIDGVIALDQHVVVKILQTIGPIEVEGQKELISSENVMQYMRLARSEQPPAGYKGGDWDRKNFINRMAGVIAKKVIARQGYSSTALLKTILQLLDEKHILLQFDDPEMKDLLARRGWDGALQPPVNSDFLMAVDTNVGFNKTNLVVDRNLSYQVDLQNLTDPQAQLEVTHINHAQVDIPCYQYPATVGIAVEQEYPFRDCYWNYLRIYTPAGSELVGSTPHAIAAGQLLSELPVPAHTDSLGNENIPGVAAYGTLLVVAPGETMQTGFDLHLPPAVLEQDRQNSNWTYRLTVQKQPGTIAQAFTLRLLLPPNAQILDSSHDIQYQDGAWQLETNLRQDLVFYVIFSVAN